MKKVGDYSNNVFFNCPFDDSYKPLFNAIVFTISDCGFKVRCSYEISEEDFRLYKIINLIKECKYGIHDLSMVKIDRNTQFPRFNMPFELGLFYGCKKFGKHKDKKFIVLEENKRDFEKFISDLKGLDMIEAHHNEPNTAIEVVSEWLVDVSERRTIPSGKHIVKSYQHFSNDLPELCMVSEWDINKLRYSQYLSLVLEWIKENEGIEIEN